jgi:hypothetical protein
MILKGSQRGGGSDLAAHLMRADENEHVELHQIRGFASDDFKGALKEAEAISRATKCRQYLFSLSLSPPEKASAPAALFETTIDKIEQRLGLEGQPRAIVFHEKEGRRHAHCVWSRIDADTPTARQLSFFKTRLVAVSRDLYLEQGWKLPRGLETPSERNPTNFTLAEWQQAKRQGLDPRWIKQAVQECWKSADSAPAFRRALEERAFFLAKGDRRGVVVLDHTGEVYALPRLLDLKTKDVRARLGDGTALPDVTSTRAQIAAQMTAPIRRHIAEARAQHAERAANLGDYKAEMTRLHRAARDKLAARQQEEWQRETRERSERMPRGLKGLWARLTGRYREMTALNEAEAKQTATRHADEKQRQIEDQLGQRAVLQQQVKALRTAQAERLRDLRRDIGRYLAFSRDQARTPERGRGIGLGLSREP